MFKPGLNTLLSSPERPPHIPENSIVEDVCISLRRVNATVAEDMLDGRYRHAPVYQDRCARHPTAVEADMLADVQLPDYTLQKYI